VTTELAAKRIEDSFFDEKGETEFVWLGMAGAGINARGTVLLIDPMLVVLEKDGEEVSETGHRFRIELPIEAKDVPRVDGVLYTHADMDHFGRPTAEVLGKLGATFVGPPPVVKGLRELGVDQKRIVVAKDFDKVRIGEVEVFVTPALHDYPSSGHVRGDCCGYVVTSADGRIWHPGDTRLIDELLDVKDVDVMFFDVADVVAHLGPRGSARLADSCGAKVMVAYHYGTYDLPPGSWGSCDPEDAKPHANGMEAEFWMPNPGEVMRLGARGPERTVG